MNHTSPLPNGFAQNTSYQIAHRSPSPENRDSKPTTEIVCVPMESRVFSGFLSYLRAEQTSEERKLKDLRNEQASLRRNWERKDKKYSREINHLASKIAQYKDLIACAHAKRGQSFHLPTTPPLKRARPASSSLENNDLEDGEIPQGRNIPTIEDVAHQSLFAQLKIKPGTRLYYNKNVNFYCTVVSHDLVSFKQRTMTLGRLTTELDSANTGPSKHYWKLSSGESLSHLGIRLKNEQIRALAFLEKIPKT